jgi:vancomycin permeability regulator SanA
MSRALFTCNALGLPAVGVEASNYYYLKRSRLYWNIREQLATVGAFWDVLIKKPLPVLGEPEPIFETVSSARVSDPRKAGVLSSCGVSDPEEHEMQENNNDP